MGDFDINRRGFLTLLGAVGVSAAIPKVPILEEPFAKDSIHDYRQGLLVRRDGIIYPLGRILSINMVNNAGNLETPLWSRQIINRSIVSERELDIDVSQDFNEITSLRNLIADNSFMCDVLAFIRAKKTIGHVENNKDAQVYAAELVTIAVKDAWLVGTSHTWHSHQEDVKNTLNMRITNDVQWRTESMGYVQSSPKHDLIDSFNLKELA